MLIKKLHFEIDIEAAPAKIWEALWDKQNYSIWCNEFCEGTYYQSNFNKGDRIHFLTPNGEGMYADIEEKIENEYIAFCHIGELKNFEEQSLDDQSLQWTEAIEDYRIITKENYCTLVVTIDTLEIYIDYFSTQFPKGLEKVKELAENK
ncbi:SRPBCC domain-containing protein [Flavobacterium sp. 20NA77.7]|uniref:SRPBCC domain-containing protein n=1 Tax=Flavobacterium nakdongensis TaxID=3073563 RepID=A0ABY9R8Z3_9FLAO|nr:SRPBCC domain-containing protein [Flavobacterium sp. 20NA77.7]WMW77055.1 SRPBCC domain-containing protein [Flavobacterium sp. 20NA77.7]